MYSEPSQGDGDDSATNGLEIGCRGPGLTGMDIIQTEVQGTSESGATWGSWSEVCPSGQAVNAIQVKN